MAFAVFGFGLADPVPQGFVVDVQLLGELAERGSRVGLPIEPDCAFAQLIGVLHPIVRTD
jgi:hypothetical protein